MWSDAKSTLGFRLSQMSVEVVNLTNKEIWLEVFVNLDLEVNIKVVV